MKKLFAIVYITLALVPAISFAQNTPPPTEYELLAPIPLSGQNKEDLLTNAAEYIPGIIKLAIAIAGGLAVIKIIFGGIQYMSTDSFNGKSEGKQTIQDAIWGLLLVISSVVILNTINPKLVNINLSIEGLKVGPAIQHQTGDASTTPGSIVSDDFAKGCLNCVVIHPYTPSNPETFPSKPPGANPNTSGCLGFNILNDAPVSACLVNGTVHQKLVTFNKLLIEESQRSKISLNWQVTEAYPPTVTHKSPCHKVDSGEGGLCVDASLTDEKTIGRVARFMLMADKAGFSFLYEVPSDRRKLELQNHEDTKRWANRIIVTAGIGEHIHLK